MARLTIKSVNVAELMLGLFGLRGNRPEKLVPDEIKKLHDLLKKKLCELARKLFDPSGTYATADSESFDKGGKPRTVTAHYRIAYGIELQYPWLPLLAVDCGAVRVRCRDEHGADVLDQNGRPTFDVAKENGKAMRKRIHFPPELLQLVEHQKHSANEAELLRTAVCKIPKCKLATLVGPRRDRQLPPRQAIAQFFDLVGRSLCDRGLKHWPEWDYHMINPRDIENFVRDLGAKRARPDYVTPIIIKDKTKAMSPSKPYDRLKKAFGGKVMTGCVGIETIQKQRAGSAELSKLATSLANNIVGKLGVVVKRTFPAAPNLQGGGAFPPERLPESSAAHPLLKEKTPR
ncbi:dienelactone hydrolase-like protein [Aureococcus anophagefferens]|nr:dienelactone hydrolase-like protein [Aureococcus anophagefferens]